MMIKEIFDEISAESGDNAKIEILRKYVDNHILKEVLYLANSKRIKFYIKRLPEYKTVTDDFITLEDALVKIKNIYQRYVTGNEALNFLQEILSNLHPDDAYIVERIIEKDCKIGMGTTFMNKVFKGLIEDTPYQGCIPFDEKKAKALFNGGKSVLSEVKADGRYVNVIIRNNDVEMESRQGEATILGKCELISQLSKLEDCVLNGELIMDKTPRLIANGIIASIIDYNLKLATRTDSENKKKYDNFLKEKEMTIEEATEKIKLKVWDIIDVDEYFEAKSTTKRIDRLNRLKSVIKNTDKVEIIEHRIVSTYDDAMSHFSELLELGEEGTVIKSLDGGWKNGKPTYQIKLKLELDLDLKIIGFNYGNKGTKNENLISSITCQSSCGKLITNAQGLTEKTMTYVTENKDKLLGTIIEIKCNGLSSNSKGGCSVFYPAFKGFRDDKSVANTLEECIDIQNGAIGLSQ